MKNTRMRKFLKVTISVLACLAIMTSTLVGFAYSIDYAGGDENFELSGKASEAIAGQIVTLKVEDAGDNVVFTRQTETNGLGEYTFEFDVLDGVSGELTVTVNAGGAVDTKTIYKSTAEEVNRALATASSGIVAAVAANDSVTGTPVAKILQVDATKFTTGGVLTTYVEGGSNFLTLDIFKSAYKKGLLLQGIKNSAADAELYTLLEDSGMASVLTGNASEVFAAYGESDKIATLSQLKSKSYTTDATFKTALTEAVIINELSKVSTDNEKWAVLSNNSDYLSAAPLSMNLGKYEGMSKFATFKTELFKNGITSISTMKTNAEALYSSLNQANLGGGGSTPDRGEKETVSVSSGLITKPAQPATFGFKDLAGYEWAQDAILTLAADGVINGKSQNVFAPGDNVTRAEFAKIIVGAFGLVDANATANFKDTPKSHWSYSYVASAVANKIVNGVSANSFNPEGKITRQDMAAICYRALSVVGVETSAAGKVEFADAANISDYAKEAVEVLSGLGIINGKGNGKFAPNDYATRAEAAKIIHLLRGLN